MKCKVKRRILGANVQVVLTRAVQTYFVLLLIQFKDRTFKRNGDVFDFVWTSCSLAIMLPLYLEDEGGGKTDTKKNLALNGQLL